MEAPRLDFAVIGTHSNGDLLACALRDAGHRIHWPVEWDDVSSHSAVLLRVSAEDIPDVVERLADRVTASHIVIHSALEIGAAPFLELPAVGIAMHRLDNGDVVVDTNDDIAATVASVLIAELHGNPVAVPAAERPRLARALELVKQAQALEWQALETVESEAARDLLDRLCGLY